MDTGQLDMSQQLSGLPMKDLISSPLTAASDANAHMALTQTKFMLETCFEKTGEDKTGEDIRKPIMITLEVSRPVINSQGVPQNDTKSSLKLPLLTILPLNSLAVTSVDVSFEMEVKSSTSNETSSSKSDESEGNGGFDAKIGYGLFSASVTGSISTTSKSDSSASEHYKKSNSATYTVNVKAEQLPLPEGVNTIILAYTKAIEPIVLRDSDGNSDGKSGGKSDGKSDGNVQ